MPGTNSRPLQFTVETSSGLKDRTGILVIGAFADGTLPALSQKVDEASKGHLSAVLKRGDLDKKAGASLLFHDLAGVQSERVLVVSFGPPKDFGDKAFRDAIVSAAKTLHSGVASDAIVTLADVDLPGRSDVWRLQEATRLIADGAYRFDVSGGAKPQDGNRGARNLKLVISGKPSDATNKAVRDGQAMAEGMALARDLGNLPGNICTPAFLAETAQALGKEFDFTVEVLESDEMKNLGMRAALAVGQGSAQPSKFIAMHYNRRGKAQPFVLVGKGVTFDSGGISLKPGEKMDEMKFDMCGAASVLGAMKTVARLGLPINLIALIPAVENMPGGNAIRPGDVITSMSGQTIEVLNTDAEGRLTLADALTYAERFNPACVIDIATLTGACVIALGNITTGLFANDDELAEQLLESGIDTGDRAWRLPLFDEYQDMLKSNFADMSNIGGRPAGAITAACFLQRFVNNYKWAHLDIAGTNALTGDNKGATGRPVPLLTEFLIARAENRASQTTRARAA